MKDLIRQILREYTEPKVSIIRLDPNSQFLMEILSESKEQNDDSKFIVDTGDDEEDSEFIVDTGDNNKVGKRKRIGINIKKDNINYYIAKDQNKKYEYPLPISISEFYNIIEYLKNYFISHYNFPENDPNCILHKYQNDEGENLNKKFKLETISKHFVERLYRKSDPEYRNNTSIENPDKTEGVDLFLNNLNDISKKIDNLTNWGKGFENKKEFYLLKKTGTPFWIVFSLVKPKSKDVSYYVEFVTQMKGLTSTRKNTITIVT
jgi:hypothetical protein